MENWQIGIGLGLLAYMAVKVHDMEKHVRDLRNMVENRLRREGL